MTVRPFWGLRLTRRVLASAISAHLRVRPELSGAQDDGLHTDMSRLQVQSGEWIWTFRLQLSAQRRSRRDMFITYISREQDECKQGNEDSADTLYR